MYDYKYCAVAGSQRSVSQMSVNTHRNPVIPAVCMRTLPRYESLFVRFTMRAPLTLSAEFRKVFLTKKETKKKPPVQEERKETQQVWMEAVVWRWEGDRCSETYHMPLDGELKPHTWSPRRGGFQNRNVLDAFGKNKILFQYYKTSYTTF